MRCLLLVPAAAAVLLVGLAGPASANHPCHNDERPCEGHTCIELYPPFLVPC